MYPNKLKRIRTCWCCGKSKREFRKKGSRALGAIPRGCKGVDTSEWFLGPVPNDFFGNRNEARVCIDCCKQLSKTVPAANPSRSVQLLSTPLRLEQQEVLHVYVRVSLYFFLHLHCYVHVDFGRIDTISSREENGAASE